MSRISRDGRQSFHQPMCDKFVILVSITDSAFGSHSKAGNNIKLTYSCAGVFTARMSAPRGEMK